MSSDVKRPALRRYRADGSVVERYASAPLVCHPGSDRLRAFDNFSPAEIAIALQQDPGFELPRGCYDRDRRMRIARSIVDGNPSPSVAAVAEGLGEQAEAKLGVDQPLNDVVVPPVAAQDQASLGAADPVGHLRDAVAGGVPLERGEVVPVVHERTVAATPPQ